MEKVAKIKVRREASLGAVSILLIQGDVAQIPASVLVCPTNTNLNRNSGMTEYIIQKAGARIHYDKNNWRRENETLEPSEIYVSGGGDLKVNHIFHVSVPPCDRNNPEPQIRFMVVKLLEKCDEIKAGTLAIPCLPREAYAYLPENCAFGYLSAITEYLAGHPTSGVKEVKILTIDKNSSKIFESEFDRKFGLKKEKKGIFSFLKKKKKKNQEDMNIELK